MTISTKTVLTAAFIGALGFGGLTQIAHAAQAPFHSGVTLQNSTGSQIVQGSHIQESSDEPSDPAGDPPGGPDGGPTDGSDGGPQG